MKFLHVLGQGCTGFRVESLVFRFISLKLVEVPVSPFEHHKILSNALTTHIVKLGYVLGEGPRLSLCVLDFDFDCTSK